METEWERDREKEGEREGGGWERDIENERDGRKRQIWERY